LIHDYISSTESYYVLPLNIGFIAAYANDQLKEKVKIKLFKYPRKFLKAIDDEGFPDIIGLSYYTWNEELSTNLSKEIKARSPKTLVVLGGPNIDATSVGLSKFLEANSFVDYYIPFEGEEIFTNLVKRFHELGKDINKIKQETIIGAACFSKNLNYSPFEHKNRDKEITYPSAYLSGVLDEFLSDPYLYPLFETNRGCPFSCSFCVWGVSALSRVRIWDIEQIKNEFKYYLEKNASQSLWFLADANFGILKRDVEIAQTLKSFQGLPNGPRRITAWNSKNTTDRNILIQEIFGDLSGFLVAFQSLDDDVLKSIKRDNIRKEALLELVEYFKTKDADVETDILIGLPSETLDKHIETLRKCLEYDIRYIRGMNIRLLQGSDMGTRESIAKYGIKTKFRIIRDSYGKYWDKWIIDCEEVVRSTNTLSGEEMETLRLVHFYIWLFWNMGILQPLMVFGRLKGVNPVDQIMALVDTKKMSDGYSKIIEEYYNESRQEFFDTKEKLIQFYQSKDNIEGELDRFNNKNFIYSPRLVLDNAIFNEIVQTIASSISSNLNDEEDKLDLKAVEEYTLARVCTNLQEMEKMKTITLNSQLYKTLSREKLIRLPPYDGSKKEVEMKMVLEGKEFIEGELENAEPFETRYDKIVTAKFLSSLIYQPVSAG
jgi:radical SAM superfamily enzyme YgiQ (UPF0313 family)|tara:strand:+ start:448 stop:2424 length:1977 start_codon:yes stop_codon:yes gene_type:complete